MINEDNLKIARHNFALASKDFGFEFESPFTLTNEIEAFGYIPNYGSKNGVVICLFDVADVLVWYQLSAIGSGCKYPRVLKLYNDALSASGGVSLFGKFCFALLGNRPTIPCAT